MTNRGGRPSKYSADLAAKVISLVEEGHTIREIASMEGMPSWATMRRWLHEDKEGFSSHYARAREVAADAYEAEIKTIIDNVHAANAKASAVKIAALQWLASRRAPKRYGRKVSVTRSDGSVGGPVSVVINPVVSSRED